MVMSMYKIDIFLSVDKHLRTSFADLDNENLSDIKRDFSTQIILDVTNKI